MSNATQVTPTQVTFAIKECVCSHFAFTDFGLNNKVKIESDKYLFNFTFNLEVKQEISSVIINLFIDINANTDSIKDKIAEIKSLNTFHILNLENIIKKGDRGIEIPNELIAPLLSISLSNLRGMLSVKFEKSLYTNSVVPIVDATQFLPKPIATLG